MQPPRMKGAALRAARVLSESPVAVHALRELVMRDYGVPAMMALPAEARPNFDLEPRPIQAAPPRTWESASLPAPKPRPGARTSRELVAAYRSKQISPVEVLARLERRVASGRFGESTHSPFVATDWERARAAAEASAKRYREGRPLGPLDGVPVPIKDQHHMVGLPTRGGTKYRNTPELHDAFMIGTLREAGAVLYAKTHLTEFGMTPTGFNPNYRMPRNVYRRDKAAGGSSTGSAVAAALGLCTVASGSDGGGSIRTPSSLNGVFGIKPTFLRVSRTGDFFAGTVGHTGPIGQSTADLVDFMSVACTHRDSEDPISAYAPDVTEVAKAWESALGRGVCGARIGVPAREWRDADGRIAAVAMDALRALEREGAKLVDVSIPYAEHAMAVGVLAIGPECAGGVIDDLANHADAMSDDFVLAMNLLGRTSANEFVCAMRTRAALRRSVAGALRDLDLLALPSVAGHAPDYSLDEDGVAVVDPAVQLDLLRFAFLANLTGLPACSVPVGLDAGLPVGLQLIGDAWDEASVLAVMAHLERMGATELPAPPGRYDLLAGA